MSDYSYNYYSKYTQMCKQKSVYLKNLLFYITSKADYEFCGKNSSIFPIDFSLKTAYTESRNNPTFPIL